MALSTKPKRPATTHHRKRTGQHHRQTKRYAKTYWPYLPLVMIVVLGIVANSLWASVSRGVLGYATEMSASSLLQSTNAQRASNGASNLSLNAQLSAAAQAKANDMAARDYWSHNTPEGSPPWAFITNAGYSYLAAGENLAYGFDTSGEAVTGWMNSPEHRANLLNGGYADVGFGIANSASYQGTGPETIVVAMYGKPAAAPAPQPVATAPPVASKPAAPTAQPTPQAEPSAPTANNAEQPAPAAQPKPTAEVASTPKSAGISKQPEKRVTRIQLVSKGAAPWSAFAVSSLATIALVLFFIRHGLLWHRVLRKGELFIVKHRVLDIVMISLGVLGFILTRTVGTIH